MSTLLRVGAFGAVLVAIFATAYGVGRAVDEDPPTYAMKVVGESPVGFRIEKDGEPVTRFALRHEKRLHLIAVRDDFTGFRHVHPTMAADGTWTSDLDLGPGTWRLYGDYQPTGEANRVSSATVTVDGWDRKAAPPEVARSASVDGYDVTLTGDLAAGGEGTMLELAVTRAGKPVTLQPYLGAFGHLVVLRGTDMKYLHVHPEESAATEPIPFHVEVPTAGRYYLYLDFQVEGVVRTATFVLEAEKAASDHGETGGMEHGDH
ncbi:MAG: heavy-metal-associated domain-containing protein [Nocardioidaceae bacterium]|nr:heavy-metal-associated domain-containing protein [Nocardioidaceae bacterium]